MFGLYRVSIVSMFILGIVHMGFVAGVDSFDLNVFWFIGTGLALIFCSCINYINYQLHSLLVRKVSIPANALVFLFAVTLAVIFKHIPAAVVCLNALILLFCTLRIRSSR